MILVVAIFAGIGVFFIYVAIRGRLFSSFSDRIFIGVIGAVFFMNATIFLILELLVIRKFPKYEKLRRMLFNSDYYFTESNSREYYVSYQPRDRAFRAFFDLITSFADAEHVIGKRLPIKYKMYILLMLLMCVLSGISLVAMTILGENKTILPEILQNDLTLAFVFISIAVIFIMLAFFFLRCAYKEALMATLEIEKWKNGNISCIYRSLIFLLDETIKSINFGMESIKLMKLKLWYAPLVKTLNCTSKEPAESSFLLK